MSRLFLLAARDPVEWWFGEVIGNKYLRLAVVNEDGVGILLRPFSFNERQCSPIKITGEFRDDPDYCAACYYPSFRPDLVERCREIALKATHRISFEQWINIFLLGRGDCPPTSYDIVNEALRIAGGTPRPIGESPLHMKFSLRYSDHDLGCRVNLCDEPCRFPVPRRLRLALGHLSPSAYRLHVRCMAAYSSEWRDVHGELAESRRTIRSYEEGLREGCIASRKVPPAQRYPHAVFIGEKDELRPAMRRVMAQWDGWLRELTLGEDAVIFPLRGHTEDLNTLAELVLGKHAVYPLTPPTVSIPRCVYLDHQPDDAEFELGEGVVLTGQNLDLLKSLETNVLEEILVSADARTLPEGFARKLKTQIAEIIAFRQST